MGAGVLRDARQVLGSPKPGMRLAVYPRSGIGQAKGIDHRRMPDDAVAAAHEIFAVLREFDARGAMLIWIEQPPPSADWEGVLDRLQRAAAA
jgi:L-threonylcarbamoyladenylate synthase